MVRVRSDIRPDDAHKDGSALERLLIVKLAAPVLEFADRRRAESPVAAGGKIHVPLVGLGIVEKQSQPFEMAGRTVGLDLLKLRTPIPNFFHDDSPIQIDPRRRASERLQEASDLCLPGAQVEVEIVLAVSRRAGLWRTRSAWRRLRKRGKGRQQKAKRAKQNISPDTAWHLHHFLQIHDSPAFSFQCRVP